MQTVPWLAAPAPACYWYTCTGGWSHFSRAMSCGRNLASPFTTKQMLFYMISINVFASLFILKNLKSSNLNKIRTRQDVVLEGDSLYQALWSRGSCCV